MITLRYTRVLCCTMLSHFRCVCLFATPCTVDCQVSWSMRFSRQESCNGLPCPPPGSCWVTKLCPTPCDPMDCSTPGFSVLHCLLELAQTHGLWVDDAIQPSHPSPAFNLSQHQSLFQWVGCSHRVTKVLELQHQSFQGIFRWLEAIVLHLILQTLKF